MPKYDGFATLYGVQNAEGLVGARMLMAFCPPLGMVGNMFAWSSPVDQLAANGCCGVGCGVGSNHGN